MDNNQIFYGDQEPDYARDKITELPHHRITVRIRLNPSNLPDQRSMEAMSKELEKKNMDLRVKRTNNIDIDIILIVSGTPPDHGFDRHKVLEIVQKYSTDAQFLVLN